VRHLVVILSISFCTCFAQNGSFDFETELENNFREDSNKISDKLINSWKRDLIPMPRDSISETYKQIYDVYNSLFESDLFLEEINEMLMNKLTNIILIQSEITFTFFDSIPRIDKYYDFNTFLDSAYYLVKDTIRNFRPTIDLLSKSILYWDDKYKNIFIEFLFDDEKLFDEKWSFIFFNFPLSLQSKNNFRPVPYILNIFINTDFSKALVYYYFIGEGKVGILEKDGDDWKLLSTIKIFTE